MISEAAYSLGDHARRFGRWLVWHPLRLGLVLLLLVVVWLALASQSGREETGPNPSPTATSTDGLPKDWQSWPKTTAQTR